MNIGKKKVSGTFFTLKSFLIPLSLPRSRAKALRRHVAEALHWPRYAMGERASNKKSGRRHGGPQQRERRSVRVWHPAPFSGCCRSPLFFYKTDRLRYTLPTPRRMVRGNERLLTTPGADSRLAGKPEERGCEGDAVHPSVPRLLTANTGEQKCQFRPPAQIVRPS